MAAIAIRDQIRKLVELQKIDKEIYDFKKELQEKPIYLEELRQEFEAKKARLKSLEDKSKTMQVDRKSKELELKTKEEEIAKANAQLFQIKTNKEYTAKLSEIEHMKADKSIIEEKILLSYDDTDKVTAEIEKEKKVLADEEKEYLAKKKEIEETLEVLQDRVLVLESQRKHLTPDVDKDILSRYELIVSKKDGLAIVPIQTSSCGGCFMNVPSQTINEIKMHDHLVTCEICARILYIEDDL